MRDGCWFPSQGGELVIYFVPHLFEPFSLPLLSKALVHKELIDLTQQRPRMGKPQVVEDGSFKGGEVLGLTTERCSLGRKYDVRSLPGVHRIELGHNLPNAMLESCFIRERCVASSTDAGYQGALEVPALFDAREGKYDTARPRVTSIFYHPVRPSR